MEKDNNLKVIIFDFDETMYFCETLKESYIDFIKTAITSLSNNTEEKALELMEQYGFMKRGESRISFGKNCDKFGVLKDDWDRYRVKNFFQFDYANAKIVDNNLYKKLSKSYSLYIVSNEVLENLKYKAEKLGIDLSPFKNIFAPKIDEVLTYSNTKKQVYEKIKQIENCHFDQMIVIGDRYSVDIEPLVELGGKGLLVKHTDEIENFIETCLGKQ